MFSERWHTFKIWLISFLNIFEMIMNPVHSFCFDKNCYTSELILCKFEMKEKHTANLARDIQRKHADVSEKIVGEILKKKFQKQSTLKFLSLTVYLLSCYILLINICISFFISISIKNWTNWTEPNRVSEILINRYTYRLSGSNHWTEPHRFL